MLPRGHVLFGLDADAGFKISGEQFSQATVDLLAAAAPVAGELKPLRQVIPFTEGRAVGWKLIEHLNAAKARHWPTFKPWEFTGQQIAICGGGPSLGHTLHDLRTLQKGGVKVMAINRTHDFLLDLPKTHGLPWIKPWAGIILEAIPHAANYMRPTAGVRYYVGSQCHPDTFDRFDKREHFIWHAASKQEFVDALTPEERKHMVPAIGSTCGLRACVLAYMMGFQSIHLFGFDSCYSEAEIKNGIRGPDGSLKLHSYHKPEAIHDCRMMVVKGWADGKDREYWGNGNMLAQADEFQRLIIWRNDMLKTKRMEPHNLIVHGFGLIPDIARANGLHIDNYLQKASERKAA